jgi:hypothetical protein
MIRKLHSVQEVIDELGGYDAVKSLTNRSSQSVIPTWKWRKKFPPNTFAVMRAALLARGAIAPASLWGMPELQMEATAS